MNVALLCKDESVVAKEILQAMHREGIRVQNVIAEIRRETPLTAARMIEYTRGRSFAELCRMAIMRARGRRRTDSSASNQSGPLPVPLSTFAQSEGVAYFRVPDLNGPESIDLLKQAQPDLLVLGGTRIIRRRILDIPRLGTVNSHMGLLPKYRGMNVSEWSAFNGDAVGVTVHYVNEGVDTGGILGTELIDVTDCSSIERLRAKVGQRQLPFLAECVRMLADGNAPPPIHQDTAEGKQYYVMHPRLREMLEKKLRRTVLTRDLAQPQAIGRGVASSGGT